MVLFVWWQFGSSILDFEATSLTDPSYAVELGDWDTQACLD